MRTARRAGPTLTVNSRMPSPRNLIAILKRHAMPPAARSFPVDLGLAAGFFCAWLALCGFSPVVAAAMDELRLAVRTGPYRLQWPPYGPAVVGIAGLVLAWVRHRTPSLRPRLHERLQRATLLAAALLALRLLALFDPLVYVFPFLTILWSPHALWAVALVFLGYVHLPLTRASWSPRKTYVAAGILFAVCLLIYTLYALYFCQVTMLHSDEGQYLRVTQSLLRDGDMDLANNLDIEQIKEFHVTDFGLNNTPAAPEGRIYSKHPIGLSIALVPAYWWGLEAWGNPRLGTALFIAVIAGVCVPLLFLYLTSSGAAPWAALLAVSTMAGTGPCLYYSNQLYPEFPAMMIVLTVLLALVHLQIPNGAYRSLGRWETPLLGLLTLLLCCLPFLHPRIAPLGLCCGVLVLLQAWFSPRRWFALCLIGMFVAGGLYAVFRYHYALSEDWLGPLRPGIGPWGEDPFGVATWKDSLPGLWLQSSDGILETSPIFFFSLPGLLILARVRDRRVIVSTLLFGATAGVFGLHTIWETGYVFPGRFMVIAIPAVVIWLSWGWPVVLRRATTGFLAALSLVLSIESVTHTLALPELGFNGMNLLGRSINRFYPLHSHFFTQGEKGFPFPDLIFWSILATALVCRPRSVWFRTSLIAAASLAPFFWSRTDVSASRWERSRSPYMTVLSREVAPMIFEFDVPRTAVDGSAPDPEWRLRARPGHTAVGKVDESRLSAPLLRATYPGVYRLNFQGLRVDAQPDGIAGHLTRSERYTVKAVSNWRTSTNFPLIGGRIDGDHSLTFRVDRPLFCDVSASYTGTGELALDRIRAAYVAFPHLPEPETLEIERVSYAARERPIRAVHRVPNLQAGQYRLRFNLKGSTFARFFERFPEPIKTAVYTLPPPARPVVEGAHPPWWLSIPFAGGEACELRFVLDKTQDIHVLLQYDGKADLDLTEIVLYRETYKRQ